MFYVIFKNKDNDMWQNMVHMINQTDDICPKSHDFGTTKSTNPFPDDLTSRAVKWAGPGRPGSGPLGQDIYWA
jgi:hypothetical protein